MAAIHEPARDVPVVHEADICVLGGSCTGVFAAVRAARLGARVVLVEKQNCFGGVATCGLVNIWHSLQDTEYRQQIIAGLTAEVLDRLEPRGAVSQRKRDLDAIRLNTEELKIELDELVKEAGVHPYLHTVYCAPQVEDGEVTAVFVENKSGRGAIRAKAFIDATGDADLCAHLGVPCDVPDLKQPPTVGFKTYSPKTFQDVPRDVLLAHKDEYDLPAVTGWRAEVPGVPEICFHAESKIYGANCADADSLTHCEIEGRRQVRAYMDIIRGERPDLRAALVAIGSYIGIRETRHVHGLHRLTEQEVLDGVRFDDAIANGTYRVDIHHDEDAGITFRYLNGAETVHCVGREAIVRRWRDETDENPTFYQIPYRSLVPKDMRNVLVAGRAIDADKGAFGAIRVMVNTNQTGEAAGVAAHFALDAGVPMADVDAARLRKTLGDGGSAII